VVIFHVVIVLLINYFIVNLMPAYNILPVIEPQTIEASKYGLKGSSAAIIASFSI
jgi:hypothetical protein